MRNLSLRLRLVLTSAFAVMMATTFISLLAYATIRQEIAQDLDQQLHNQAGELRQQAQDAAWQNLPVLHLNARFGERNGLVQVIDTDGHTSNVTSPQGELKAADLPISQQDQDVASGAQDDTYQTRTVEGQRVRVLTSQILKGVAVQVALPIDGVEDQLKRLATTFILLWLLATLATGQLVWRLSQRALAPVKVLTDTAQNIADTRDLTQRIQTDRADELGQLSRSFNTMMDALETSVTAQRQLVADASHELRTPLASLRTNIELIPELDKLPKADQDDVLESIVGQVDELTRLVSDVMELARDAEPALDREQVRLGEVVEKVAARSRRNWPGLQIELVLDDTTVEATPARLERAVMNLVDNAGKFSPPGGTIKITLHEGTLTVEDQGPGVPEDDLEHVFDRFYRSPEARGMEGSGLGLAIVKQLADTHAGSVKLENTTTGAKSTLRLPPYQDGKKTPKKSLLQVSFRERGHHHSRK